MPSETSAVYLHSELFHLGQIEIEASRQKKNENRRLVREQAPLYTITLECIEGQKQQVSELTCSNKKCSCPGNR